MPDPAPRAVRVFVSSTFRDFTAERDRLARLTFPRLRRTCEERAVVFTDVDLRWGITDEQTAEGEVLPICLAEIDASRPNRPVSRATMPALVAEGWRIACIVNRGTKCRLRRPVRHVARTTCSSGPRPEHGCAAIATPRSFIRATTCSISVRTAVARVAEPSASRG